ncbi:MAG: alpha/beta hydrolase [Parachlamydiaceae bacterium]|nr:alpha/beta hydrolase [Parachlamydiaceae bacterium]
MFKISSFALVLGIVLLLGLSSCHKKKRAEVKKQKVKDIEIAYYTHGHGEPLVLIMGFKGTMAMWDPAFIRELAKHYKVIAFDNRGMGISSDTKENNTTIQQMSNDTAEFIPGLGYQKVNLLGWSMGTSIALQLALDHPEMLNTLILCSPNPGGKNHAFNQSVYEKLTSTETSKEELLSLMFPDSSEGRRASDEYTKRFKKAVANGYLPNDLEVSKQTIERQSSALKLRGQDEHLYEKLPSIKVPTLVAGGMMDVIDPPENTRAIANRIPYAWAAFFPNSGHGFTSQDHLEFSRLIHIFIESETSK